METVAGQVIRVGPAFATVLPDFDFETYSEAGYVFDGQQFRGATKHKRGLSLVGAAAYAEHHSTEILSMAYDLKDGWGPVLWRPGDPAPIELFNHIRGGGLLEAHNSLFEFFIWNFVGHLKLGWPVLNLDTLRCSMAKCRHFSLPGKLDTAGAVRGVTSLKDKTGASVMRRLSVPRKPTLKNRDLRYTPSNSPEDFDHLYRYNIQDIRAEASLSQAVPDLSNEELVVWKTDQRINVRGVAIDMLAVEQGIEIYETESERLLMELSLITGGRVSSESELQKMLTWLADNGLRTASLDSESVDLLLERNNLPSPCRRVLEIRKILAGSSVKKLYSIRYMANKDNRVRGLFAYCGGDRTRRWAGRGPQPQNLPSSGPMVKYCSPPNGCGSYYSRKFSACPTCGNPEAFSDTEEWSVSATEFAISNMSRAVYLWGSDVLDVISGCLRGMFISGPGKDLVCSDFSAIEGVVAAMLAREEWRVDVFRTHGKIYEMGASKITGVPFEEMMAYKDATGNHHPTRKTIGKVSELASGFGGWINAWVQFGADEFMSEAEMKEAILAWREASPNIVEMWGGQHRKVPGRWEFVPELYGLEGACVMALLNPGSCFSYNGIMYGYDPEQKVLYCKLLSGGFLHYHNARLVPVTARNGCPAYQITYEGTENSGWVTKITHGGKLFENVVQATARDVQANSIVALERAGYPVVLHVHDEIVSEVTEGTGCVATFEKVMSTMPSWARDWPIKASGGWVGKRYRKD